MGVGFIISSMEKSRRIFIGVMDWGGGWRDSFLSHKDHSPTVWRAVKGEDHPEALGFI